MRLVLNKNLFIFWIIFVVAACGKYVDLSDAYSKKSIVFSFKTAADLNRIKDKTHILHSFVYQLSDLNGFTKLASSKEGLRILMEGKSFDPSVLDVKLIPPLMPDQETVEYIDKVEGTKFVALVSCYSFNITRNNVLRVYQIPTEEEASFMVTKKRSKLLRVKFVMGSSRIVSDQKVMTPWEDLFDECSDDYYECSNYESWNN